MTTIAETPKICGRRRPVGRCLFGRPDTNKINESLKKELNELYDKDKRKWNFDFVNNVPIELGAGDYHFEAVPAEEVPHFYHERQLRSRKPPPRLIPEEEHQPACSSTSMQSEYTKPVTRSATRLTIRHANETIKKSELKQTKLTNYMPVRKRLREPGMVRSASVDVMSELVLKSAPKKSVGVRRQKSEHHEKAKSADHKNDTPNKLSSVSDTAIVASPRSPPAKKFPRRQRVSGTSGAGDY
ncbi:unnamed protein product [Caenorhabditis bovis]|uniref:Cyclin-dependent kinase inhibitor domain-containing protein n=1 Tax=Caenorhabditis bovis TaxID=2654633 RepID=A0A8S1EVS6_9PELO|nr:unnamed protein product [Caenorhabditis bovis]